MGLLSYWNTLFFPFVHDDIVFIKNNPHIQSLHHWPEIFLKATLPYDISSGVNPYYRPVLEVIQRLQYQIFAEQAYGYHLTNILFHILNVILVWSILKRITKRENLAWLVALIFLLHPIQTESVACISGFSNLLFLFFVLLAFMISLYTHNFNKWKRVCMYTLCIFLYIAALMVKEQAIVLPFLIILSLFIFPSIKMRQAWRVADFKLPLILLAVTCFYFIWRKILFGSTLVPILEFQYELFLRLLAIPRSLLMYGMLLLFPVNLHYYRSVNVLDPVGPTFLILGLILLGIVVYIKKSRSEYIPILLFGLGWFVMTLFPVLNILPLINEYSFIANYEHFLYVPSIGFFLMIAVMLFQLRDKNILLQKKSTGIIFVTVLMIALSGLTFKQNTNWRGSIPLFERVLKFEKGQGRIHALLGKNYYFNKQYDKAIQEFEKTIQIMKGYLEKVEDQNARRVYLGYIKGAHFDMAHCFEGKKEFDSAIAHYQHALIIDPHDAVIINNIGTIYLQSNKLDQAVFYFTEALKRNPGDLSVMSNLSICFIRQENYIQAEQVMGEILKIKPQHSPTVGNLQALRRQLKKQ